MLEIIVIKKIKDFLKRGREREKNEQKNNIMILVLSLVS